MKNSQEKYQRRQKLVVVMRLIILVVGIFQLFNEAPVGVAILLSLFAISLPGLVTRNFIKALPLEFELILFVMVILQFVIGETLNFYDQVPYFDKFVHFTIPLFIGFIGSMLVYTMYATGKLITTPAMAFIIVVLLTLGIGAAWEIVEYFSDIILNTHLQASLTADPLVDTMNDLIADTLGGIFGALVALRYVRAESSQDRLRDLTAEITQDFAARPRKT